MYKFDEKNHIHTLDGKPLMGVTTVLSVISKPALIQWSANMACDYISDWVETRIKKQSEDEPTEEMMVLVDDESIDEIRGIIKQARTAHRKKKESAGDWGTTVHKAIEEWIKEGKEPELEDENQVKVFNLFKDWATENKIKFLESEKHLYSKEMWIGGIVDMVFEMDGKKYIGDIKTSSGIYNEAFFQMGAYHLMLEEMGVKDIEGYIVINLKKDGKMDMKMAVDLDLNQTAFKHALGLYKVINSLK